VTAFRLLSRTKLAGAGGALTKEGISMKRFVFCVTVVLMAGAAVPASGPQLKKTDTPTTVSRCYYVGDLVLSPAQHAKLAKAGVIKPEFQLCPDFEPLVNLLTSSVAPGSWRKDGEGGGVGSMTPFYLSINLIVRTTPEIHDQMAQRLRELRKLPALQLADKPE
jgi:hypothetical protein